MSKSQTFKAAHKIAKDWMPAVKDYPIAFSLALTHVYKTFIKHHVVKLTGNFWGGNVAHICRDEDGSKCFSMSKDIFGISGIISAGDTVELVGKGPSRTVTVMMKVVDSCNVKFYV